jgi:hypothetical protein
MPDSALALELDRALAGEDAAEEARELAALLVAAAAPARFDVEEAEVEAGLARVRPPRRAPVRRRRRLAVAFAAALALAAAAALVLRTPTEDVEAKAAAALDRTYFVVEDVRPARPGLFRPTVVAGTVDPRRGLGHWTASSGGDVLTETRVEGDRVTRWDAASNTVTFAESCSALASGCADVLDPVELYRRTLGSGTGEIRKVGDDWELTLGGGRRVEQVVTVDGKTYLPTRIEWRDDGRPVSIVRIVTLDRDTRADQAAFALQPHPGARVRHLDAAGKPVRVESARAVEVPRGALWLGPTWRGYPARAEEVRFNAGTALRIRYGPTTVWNYDEVVPPAVAAAQTGFAKTATLPRGIVARIYFSDRGAIVSDVEWQGRRAAIVTAAGGKEDVVGAAESLTRAP